MGRVIDLEAWRSRRELVERTGEVGGGPREDPGPDPLIGRLEAAIARLDRLMGSGSHRIGSRVQTELLAITGAVSTGRVTEATERAERLAERLEHPSSRLAR